MTDLKTILTPPGEKLPESGPRPVLITGTGALAIVLLINAYAWGALNAEPRNVGHEVVAHKWSLAEQATEPVEWLFVGDSSCNQSVVPTVIEEITDQTALNLCTIGSATVAEDAWILDFYIENVGAPGAVVMIHTWDTWQRENDRLIQMLWKFPTGSTAWAGRVPDINLSRGNQIRTELSSWFPLYSQSASALQVFTSDAPVIRFEANGFMPMEANVDRTNADFDVHMAHIREAEFHASEWSRSSIDALVARTDEAGLTLHLVMPPVLDRLFDDPEFSAWFEGYRTFLAGYAEAHAHVLLTGPEPLRTPVEHMEKVDHVSTEGAAVYSAHVGTLLRSVE
jgi:hypothetical protein